MKSIAKWTGAVFGSLLFAALIMGQASSVFQNNSGFSAIIRNNVTPVSANYTLLPTDYYVPVTTGSSANITVTLPACSATPVGGMPVNIGQTYLIKKVDTGTKAVIIAPNGTDTIEGTNANAQFGGATSSGASDTVGRWSWVQLICASAGAWQVTDANIGAQAALTSGTPSTWTVTVPTGSTCTCADATTQANPVKCAVSGTTLTATGIATNTDVITAQCEF